MLEEGRLMGKAPVWQRANRTGVTVAEFTRRSLTGSPTMWELLRIFFKPYPANHFMHAGVDAALRLREEGLDVREVESIELGVAAPPSAP